MEDELIKYFLEKYKKCFDRFTFDKIFRFLLSQEFDTEDAKNIILSNCQLSTLVIQERIENEMYKKISLTERIATDLLKLKQDIYNRHFLNLN